MSENKKLIFYFSWVTFACLVLTYIFSVFEFSFPFLNNEFLLVLFGGLFASMGVMLLAEIKKYFINKRTTEDQIHFALFCLYNLIQTEIKNSESYLTKENCIVPENLYSELAPAIERHINILTNIDYNPIKATLFSNQLMDYKSKELFPLHINVVLCQNNLKIAINNAKIRVLKESGLSYNPISSDAEVNVALNTMKANAEDRSAEICKIQDALSKHSNNRYDWEKEKAQLDAIEINLPTLYIN